IMSARVGVVRDGEGLAAALDEIAELEREGAASQGFRNMIVTARLIAAAAFARTESRGGHFRADCPEADPAQARRSHFTLRRAEAVAAAALEARHDKMRIGAGA